MRCMTRLPRYGLVPFHVRRESDGFIFNRIWAAIKREALMVVHEGVAAPEDVDGMWDIWVGGGDGAVCADGSRRARRRARHRGALRVGPRRDPGGPRELLREYVGKGHLGVKSGRGFYDHSA